MKPRITVVDYGIGNLYSVQRALEQCGVEAIVTADPHQIGQAEGLILPGVGAFADGMRGLLDRGLDDSLRTYARSGRPLLGICLGMQLLASFSEEFGVHSGLGLIPGRVAAIPAIGADDRLHKVPHVGWSGLVKPTQATDWKQSILANTAPGEEVYLVHSFAVTPDSPAHRLADCDYDGQPICAAIQSGNIFGAQFHPEKSGEVGLRILRTFCRMAQDAFPSPDAPDASLPASAS
jgi:glutamine amidotransferase